MKDDGYRRRHHCKGDKDPGGDEAGETDTRESDTGDTTGAQRIWESDDVIGVANRDDYDQVGKRDWLKPPFDNDDDLVTWTMSADAFLGFAEGHTVEMLISGEPLESVRFWRGSTPVLGHDAGEKEKAELITQENIRKNPDYLFARINQAQFLLAKKEYEKIPEVFEHKYDLQMLYPKRRKFHISEVANFMGIMGLYFARIGEREIAEKYNDVLQEIASGFPIAKALYRELHPSVTIRVVKRLLGE